MAKLKWGMIGGGEGSQIGPAHRLGAGLDGVFDFVAGALDHRPEQGREYGQRLGLASDRAYGDWQDMLAGENGREDRVDLVTVATPNATHFEITKAFLEGGLSRVVRKADDDHRRGGRRDRQDRARDGADLCGQLRLYRLFAGAAHAGDGGARRSGERSGWSRRNSPMAITQMRPMRTIRGCAGAMIRRRRASRRNSPIAAFTRCTWPLSSSGKRSRG